MNADILIVDDSAILRKVMRKAICQLGVDPARVREAGDGAQALEALASGNTDLILLDMHMPIMGGHEFAQKKEQMPEFEPIPFVVVSTEANAQRLMEMVELGALGVLRKPFEPEDLRRMVADYLPADVLEEEINQEPVVGEDLPGLNTEDLQSLMGQTLERAAFVLTDPTEVIETDKFDQHARISYTSEAEEADVYLSATTGFLREFASSLLGIEEDDPSIDSELVHAISELANILAGEIVVQLGGEDTRFVLGVPEACVDDGIPLVASSASACLDSMGEQIQVTVFRRSV